MRTKKPSGKPKSAATLKRRGPSREQRKTVLIVCEGGKTEPYYLTDLCKELGIKPKVEIVPGDVAGTHPKTIVKYAKEKQRGNDFIAVWCIYDRDEHENIHEAHQQAKDNGFEVGFSNPCFELWILLHFENQTAEIDRHQCLRKVKKHIPDYEKGMKGVFKFIRDNQELAQTRSSLFRDEHIKNDKAEGERDNPSTTIDRLVNYLKSISPLS
jgi:RloB-like protein